MLFAICHKYATASRRLFLRNARTPVTVRSIFDAPTLFQDSAEGQRPERGLDAIEIGAQEASRLDPPFKSRLICVDLQNFVASIGPIYCSLILR